MSSVTLYRSVHFSVVRDGQLPYQDRFYFDRNAGLFSGRDRALCFLLAELQIASCCRRLPRTNHRLAVNGIEHEVAMTTKVSGHACSNSSTQSDSLSPANKGTTTQPYVFDVTSVDQWPWLGESQDKYHLERKLPLSCKQFVNNVFRKCIEATAVFNLSRSSNVRLAFNSLVLTFIERVKTDSKPRLPQGGT